MKKLFWIFTVACMMATGCADDDKTEIQSLGLDTQEITGGSAVRQFDKIASIVALLYDTKGGVCTGTLIAEDLMLTAAHCVNSAASNLRVIFAIDATSTGGSPDFRFVTDTVVPKMYATSSSHIIDHGDIALVHFSGGLPSGYEVAHFHQSALHDGDKITLAGYGMTDDVTQRGTGVLRKTQTTISDADFSKTEILIDQRRGRGACKGDSGGPAFVISNNKHYVFGVTSRGFDRQRVNCPRIAAYTSINAHWKWIVTEASKLTSAPHLGQYRWR